MKVKVILFDPADSTKVTHEYECDMPDIQSIELELLTAIFCEVGLKPINAAGVLCRCSSLGMDILLESYGEERQKYQLSNWKEKVRV